MSEASFWNSFYSSENHVEGGHGTVVEVPQEPSSFAQFCFDYVKGNEEVLKAFNVDRPLLIDLGCGTGRDSRFWANKGFSVKGFDLSEAAIKSNNEKSKGDRDQGLTHEYSLSDFTKLEGDQGAQILYSRFTLHSISRESASRLMAWAGGAFGENTLFFCEVRSVKSTMYKVGTPAPGGDPDAWINGHYRRFLRIEELKAELHGHGFTDVLFEIESDGLSVYKQDDPVLIRLLVRKTTGKSKSH